jgi:hypothetical protein
MKSKDFLNDEWSQKYKKSINCASPKGFSQRAHCAGRNKNESTDTDADLFGDKSMRDKLHQRLQAAYNSITEEADDLGIDAIFSNAKMFAKLFDKYDDQMSDDPIKDFAYKEPVQKVSRALSELEKIASDVYAYIGEQGMGEGAIITKDQLVDIYIKGKGKNNMPIQKKVGAQIPNSKVESFIAAVADKYGLNPKAFVYGPSRSMSEDAAGVGVVASKKQKNDPRYSMSLTKDVRPGEVARNMKKLHLEGNRGYSHGFASPTAPSLGGRREREDDEGYGQEEQNNYAVVIDGRTWKVFADKQQAENIARSLRNKGKKASVSITGANPSESVTEADAESDDELFGTAQTPPKTAQALYLWSRVDPNRYNFRAIAEFALSHKLTLKQALQVTSRFDEYDDQMQAEYGVDDDEMGDLFGAYEEVCDAWNTDPSGDTSTNDSWEKLGEAELEEPPERPRKTTTKTKPDIKFDIPFQQDQDHPLARTDPLDDLKKKAGLGDEPKVNIKKAKQKDTLSRTAGIGSDDMADMLGKLRNIEVDRDLEAYPDEEPPEQLPSVEVNTANLPAVAGQALQAAGVQNPDFHQVANLPGNMADQIRQLGKSLFGSLTMTPTKRIHVVANLGGQGPNSSAEVNAVAGFLKDYGRDLGPGDIDFENVMPGYKAQTHMFTAAGIRWMLVKDFAGQYIYCWPEEDSHDAQDAIGQDQYVKKLK